MKTEIGGRVGKILDGSYVDSILLRNNSFPSRENSVDLPEQPRMDLSAMPGEARALYRSSETVAKKTESREWMETSYLRLSAGRSKTFDETVKLLQSGHLEILDRDPGTGVLTISGRSADIAAMEHGWKDCYFRSALKYWASVPADNSLQAA